MSKESCVVTVKQSLAKISNLRKAAAKHGEMYDAKLIFQRLEEIC